MLLDWPEKSLRDVLLADYLIPTAKWLLGPPQQAYVLPVVANSTWESALAIWYLADIVGQLPIGDPLIRQIEAKAAQTAHWIIAQAQQLPGLAHWDGVTWDTAVCIRSLVRTLSQFGDSFSDAAKLQAKAVCSDGVKWLVAQFKAWDTEVIYPFGPADVAQILVTLLYLRAEAPEQLAESTKAIDPRSGSGVIEEIARYLIAAKDDVSHPQNPAEAVAFWGDFFQSGEVIECLAIYVADCLSAGEDLEWAGECRTHLLSCLRYMEANQLDGKWGTHSDTCRALYAYLRTSHLLQGVGQEHHVVLKALRWMCDEKQTFADGSFMHTTFLTVFYALALWEVYQDWGLVDLPIIRVYDVAFWSSPVRSTPERGMRLKLQVENDQLTSANEHLVGLRQFVRAAGAIILVGVVSALVALVVGLISVRIKIPNPNTFLVYVGVVAAIALALGGFIHRLSNK